MLGLAPEGTVPLWSERTLCTYTYMYMYMYICTRSGSIADLHSRLATRVHARRVRRRTPLATEKLLRGGLRLLHSFSLGLRRCRRQSRCSMASAPPRNCRGRLAGAACRLACRRHPRWPHCLMAHQWRAWGLRGPLLLRPRPRWVRAACRRARSVSTGRCFRCRRPLWSRPRRCSVGCAHALGPSRCRARRRRVRLRWAALRSTLARHGRPVLLPAWARRRPSALRWLLPLYGSLALGVLAPLPRRSRLGRLRGWRLLVAPLPYEATPSSRWRKAERRLRLPGLGLARVAPCGHTAQFAPRPWACRRCGGRRARTGMGQAPRGGRRRGRPRSSSTTRRRPRGGSPRSCSPPRSSVTPIPPHRRCSRYARVRRRSPRWSPLFPALPRRRRLEGRSW